MEMYNGGAWTTLSPSYTVAGDSYANTNALLINPNGTAAGNNNVFLDSSNNAFVITRNGSATQGTFTPFSNGWSNYFTTSSRLVTSGTVTLGNTWTIECWFNVQQSGQSIIVSNGAGGDPWLGVNQGASTLLLSYSGTTRSFSATFSLNTWYHLAMVSNAGTVSCYLNGVQQGSTQASPTSNMQFNYIGGYPTSSVAWYGYISNLRATNTVVYSSAFTPSTTPLTAITGTQLLTCQSNRFVDNSTNAYTFTVTGTPSVQQFNPFSSSTAYSANTNGGSMYFNGSTDYLSVANTSILQLGSSNFTIEGWVYVTATSANLQTFIAKGTGAGNQASYALQLNTSNQWVYYLSGNGSTWNIASAVLIGTPSLNTWNHIALVRNGNTITPYLNGVAGTPTTTSSSLFVGSTALTVGSDDASNSKLTGYISNARVVNGTAVYTGNFTPPTLAPLTINGPASAYANTANVNTAISTSNTALLLSGTNGNIIDQTTGSDLVTVANTQVSTALSPFNVTANTSGGSAYFNGSTDYLTASANSKFNQLYSATNPFTIEFWVYQTALPTGSNASTIAATYGSLNGWRIELHSDGKVYWVVNGSNSSAAYTVPLNSWNHLAFVWNGTTMTMYLNGVSVATSTSTWTNNSSPLYIGADPTESFYMSGYVSNFRIVNGTALYTSNFVPSTLPFTAVANTALLTCQSTTPFVDNSTNAFTLTRTGTPTASITGPFINTQGAWSNYLNGSSYYTVPNNTAFGFGTNNFTIEAWVYPTVSISASSGIPVIELYQSFTTGTESAFQFYLAADSNGKAVLSTTWISGTTQTNTPTLTGNIPLVANQWYHIAVSRSGSTVYYFVNGVSVGTGTYSSSINQGSLPVFVGARRTNTGSIDSYFTGYISNARIVNGTAVYTSNFTPSTIPLTAIANTALLTAQSSYFKDNSPNNFALSLTGSPTVTNITPFNTSGGQSILLNGTSDYLTTLNSPPLAFGGGNFTIEFWANISSTASEMCVFHNYNTNSQGVMISVNGGGAGKWRLYSGNGSWYVTIDSSTAVPINTWNHVAATRNGSTWTLWVNGVSVGTATSATNPNQDTNPITIGRFLSGTPNYFNGYISNFRITNGVARYTSNFNLPTAAFVNTPPVTTGSGTAVVIGNSVTGQSTPTVNYLVVGGGGGGGGGAGGGGGGGFLTGSGLAVTSNSTYTITVGNGGAGGAASPNGPATNGTKGGDSIFNSITATGGGYGGGITAANGTASPGGNGGSGGGGGNSYDGSTLGPGGSGNTPSTTPSQGNNGGNSTANAGPGTAGGGGGGASANGTSAISGTGGNGGNGSASTITGSTVYYAGGGGGGALTTSYISGSGGLGGGGHGGAATLGLTAGTPNTGGGGGGAGQGNAGAAGGSGIVILSYPTTYNSATVTGAVYTTTSGGNYIYTFIGNGTITF